MQNSLSKYLKQTYWYVRQLRDVRFAGLVLFTVVLLLISWSGVKTIQTNYELQKQISALQQQNDVHKLQNTNLKLQNDYYKSNQYLELSARQNFGLGKPGEKQLIVPKDVALAHAADLSDDAKTDKASAKQPLYQRNFQAWIDFFLHRQGS